MMERLEKLRARFLQQHPGCQTVRRGNALSDEAANLFLDVDYGSLDGDGTINRRFGQSKVWLAARLRKESAVYYSQGRNLLRRTAGIGLPALPFGHFPPDS